MSTGVDSGRRIHSRGVKGRDGFRHSTLNEEVHSGTGSPEIVQRLHVAPSGFDFHLPRLEELKDAQLHGVVLQLRLAGNPASKRDHHVLVAKSRPSRSHQLLVGCTGNGLRFYSQRDVLSPPTPSIPFGRNSPCQ